jgi:hypothetical protein
MQAMSHWHANLSSYTASHPRTTHLKLTSGVLMIEVSGCFVMTGSTVALEPDPEAEQNVSMSKQQSSVSLQL